MKIIGISGRKQAGKNTAANVFHGLVLQQYSLAEKWTINDDGSLQVLTHDAAGNLGWGEFDVTRKDDEFAEYANESMWPYVKLYSFADELKRMCTDLFEISHQCVWGTDEQKNTLQPHLLWENMPGVVTQKNYTSLTNQYNESTDDFIKYWGVMFHEAGPMTSREFMQFLGTEIMRKMFEPIWVNATIKKIKAEGSQLAIIADVRFPNEAEAIEEAGGLLLRLTRQPFGEDTHESELALDDHSFKHIIDNENLSLIDFIIHVRDFFNNNLMSLKQ